MFRASASPRLFPAFVAQHSLAFDPGASLTAAALDGITIPFELARAVEKRKIEFAAGRLCAREALRSIAPLAAAAAIPIAEDRGPAWPAGFVGAITHAHGFASAAVARTQNAAGVGLDSELLIEPSSAAHIAASVARVEELRALACTTGASELLLLTLVFSAKESIFKCLHRHVGQYFDFLDAEVTRIELGAGRFEARLVRALSPRLPAGAPVLGRIFVEGARVHTGTLLLSLEDGLRWS